MAPKRKSVIGGGSGKKQKAAASVSAPVPPSPEEINEFYHSTVDLVLKMMDDDNERTIADPFIKLPSKKFYPDYYSIIKEPISINVIQKRLDAGQYSTSSTDEFVNDFKLILDNAGSYNDPSSWIVQDAQKIYDFVNTEAQQLGQGGAGDGISNDNLPSVANTLVNELIDHDFPEIGVISGPFLDEIDKNEYPDYFKIIKHPTSFNKVLSAIDNDLFDAQLSVEQNLDKLYDATNLIFINAQTYNDPSSLIHQDSLKLQELFEEKFKDLKAKASGQTSKLKVRFKAPDTKDTTKLKLNLKAKSGSPPKQEKRGRKKKVIAPPPEDEDNEIKQEDTINPTEEIEGDQDSEMDEDEDPESKSEVTPPQPTLESNVMGRTTTLGSTQDVFIKDAIVSTSPSTLPQIESQYQDLVNYRTNQLPMRHQVVKKSLFPMSGKEAYSTLFEYKFPSNGYCSQSYSMVLPSESSSFISLKFSLHEHLHGIKKPDLINGQGFSNLTSDEDFKPSLYVNDEEVTDSGDIDEEKFDDGSDSGLLKLLYDLKLSYGLNIVTFECRVAPSVSKLIKNIETKDEAEEVAGRHTRHQVQQLKRSWEVEKMTFFIVCNSI